MRVMRLKENAAAGFKSLNKAELGFFPRYTRPIDGTALTTHTRYTRATQGHPNQKMDICQLLNERSRYKRVMLQPNARTPPQLVWTRGHCLKLLQGARRSVLCQMLPRSTATSARRSVTEATEIVEPLEDFWRWVQQFTSKPWVGSRRGRRASVHVRNWTLPSLLHLK